MKEDKNMHKYLVYTTEGKYIDTINLEDNVSVDGRITLSKNNFSGDYIVKRLEDIIEGKTSAIWVSRAEDEVSRSE